MNLELDDKIIKKLEKVTETDYKEGIKIDDIEYLIDDLLDTIIKERENYRDLEQNLQDNYRQIKLDSIEMYG